MFTHDKNIIYSWYYLSWLNSNKHITKVFDGWWRVPGLDSITSRGQTQSRRFLGEKKKITKILWKFELILFSHSAFRTSDLNDLKKKKNKRSGRKPSDPILGRHSAPYLERQRLQLMRSSERGDDKDKAWRSTLLALKRRKNSCSNEIALATSADEEKKENSKTLMIPRLFSFMDVHLSRQGVSVPGGPAVAPHRNLHTD